MSIIRRLLGKQFKQRVLFFLEQHLSRLFGPNFGKLYLRQVKISKRFGVIHIKLVVVDQEPFKKTNALGLAKMTILEQKLTNFFETTCKIDVVIGKNIFKI